MAGLVDRYTQVGMQVHVSGREVDVKETKLAAQERLGRIYSEKFHRDVFDRDSLSCNFQPMVVAQLEEQSLLIPDIHGLNPVIGKIL